MHNWLLYYPYYILVFSYAATPSKGGWDGCLASVAPISKKVRGEGVNKTQETGRCLQLLVMYAKTSSKSIKLPLKCNLTWKSNSWEFSRPTYIILFWLTTNWGCRSFEFCQSPPVPTYFRYQIASSCIWRFKLNTASRYYCLLAE
jgi:hypothetical protein